MSDKFISPQKIYHGEGSFSCIETIVGKRAYIVTGKGAMQRSGYLERAVTMLKNRDYDVRVFEGVEEDPSITTVLKGADDMLKFQPDWIIGLGGCSAIDAAKAMWVFYEYPDMDFEDVISLFSIKTLRNKARFLAIPSTSGTGTECTCVAVITDRDKGTKYPLVSYELCPDVAIIDAELCKSMPPRVTANTGMDALTHAIEAAVTPLADAYTDCLAERAIVDIFHNLPVAVRDGNDMQARQAMHNASALAGMSFSNALLGIAHSLAHQIGGMFSIPHGRANAILLPDVIRFNQSCALERYKRLSMLVGTDTPEGLAQCVEKLRANVNIESNFKDAGISENAWLDNIPVMAERALNDACTFSNPRKPSMIQLQTLLDNAYYGYHYKE